MCSNHVNADHTDPHINNKRAGRPMTHPPLLSEQFASSTPSNSGELDAHVRSGSVTCPNCHCSFELALGSPSSASAKSKRDSSSDPVESEQGEKLINFYFQPQGTYSFHCGRCDFIFEGQIRVTAHHNSSQSRPIESEISQPQLSSGIQETSITPPATSANTLKDSLAFGVSGYPATKARNHTQTDYQARHDHAKIEEHRLGTVHPYEDINVSTQLDVREYIIERLWDLRRHMLRSTTFKLLVGPSLGLIMLVALSTLPQRSWSNATFQLVENLLPLKRNIPKPGIIIEATRIQRIPINDDARVYLLSGSVRNDGDSPLSDILVEGLLYNNDGTRIFRGLNRISAVVGEIEARELTPEVLQRLNRDTNTPQFPASKLASSLAVGESKPFSVIMIAGTNADEFSDPEHPQKDQNEEGQLFYSTRIHSVG